MDLSWPSFAAGGLAVAALIWWFRRADRAAKIATIQAQWARLPRARRVEIVAGLERVATGNADDERYLSMSDAELWSCAERVIANARQSDGLGIDVLEHQVLEHAHQEFGRRR